MIEGLPEYPSVDLIKRGQCRYQSLRRYGGMAGDLPQSVSTTEGIQYSRDTRTCRICARRPVDSALACGVTMVRPCVGTWCSQQCPQDECLVTTHHVYHRDCTPYGVSRSTDTAVTDALRCFCEQVVRVHRQRGSGLPL